MFLLALTLECPEKILDFLSTRVFVAVECPCCALQMLSFSSRLWKKVTFSHVTSDHKDVVRNVRTLDILSAYTYLATTLPYGKV